MHDRCNKAQASQYSPLLEKIFTQQINEEEIIHSLETLFADRGNFYLCNSQGEDLCEYLYQNQQQATLDIIFNFIECDRAIKQASMSEYRLHGFSYLHWQVACNQSLAKIQYTLNYFPELITYSNPNNFSHPLYIAVKRQQQVLTEFLVASLLNRGRKGLEPQLVKPAQVFSSIGEFTGVETLAEVVVGTNDLAFAKIALPLIAANIKSNDKLVVQAAENNNYAMACFLLAHNAPTNRISSYPQAIHYAAGYGNLALLKLLLRNGANPNHYMEHAVIQHYHCDALHIAAFYGHSHIVKYLCPKFIKPSIEELLLSNFSPLHASAQAGKVEVMRYLIEQGYLLNQKSVPCGHTPLSLAIIHQQVAAVEVLLSYGASVDNKVMLSIHKANGTTATKLVNNYTQLPTSNTIQQLLSAYQAFNQRYSDLASIAGRFKDIRSWLTQIIEQITSTQPNCKYLQQRFQEYLNGDNTLDTFGLFARNHAYNPNKKTALLTALLTWQAVIQLRQPYTALAPYQILLSNNSATDRNFNLFQQLLALPWHYLTTDKISQLDDGLLRISQAEFWQSYAQLALLKTLKDVSMLLNITTKQAHTDQEIADLQYFCEFFTSEQQFHAMHYPRFPAHSLAAKAVQQWQEISEIVEHEITLKSSTLQFQ